MKKTLLLGITSYRIIISPIVHQIFGVKKFCRHEVTCSQYAQHVIIKYGALKGSGLALKRVINCQPYFTI